MFIFNVACVKWIIIGPGNKPLQLQTSAKTIEARTQPRMHVARPELARELRQERTAAAHPQPTHSTVPQAPGIMRAHRSRAHIPARNYSLRRSYGQSLTRPRKRPMAWEVRRGHVMRVMYVCFCDCGAGGL